MWGDDEVDTDLLRPSPAAQPVPSGSGRWERLETDAGSPNPTGTRRTERSGPDRSTDAWRPGAGDATRRPTDTAGAEPDRGRRGRRAVVAALLTALAALAVGPLQHLYRSPDRSVAAVAGRSQPQLPGPSGAATLRSPVVLALAPAPAPPTPCPEAAGIRCVPPASVLTVDEVTSVRAVDRSTGAALLLSLPGWDATTLAARARGGQRLTARIGTAAPVPAGVEEGGTLVLPVRDRAAAVRTLGGLGLVPAREPRTGSGALARPLELWIVRPSPGPCRVSPVAGARGVLVVDRGTECLQLRGPAVRLRSVADLRLDRPTGKVPYWLLSLELVEADRPALARLTRDRARSRGRIAFVVDGRVVTGQPTVTAEVSGRIRLGLADEAEGRLLVGRLRP